LSGQACAQNSLDLRLSSCRIEHEIVVVDDNSPDGTQEVVKHLQEHFGDERVVCPPLQHAFSSRAIPTTVQQARTTSLKNSRANDVKLIAMQILAPREGKLGLGVPDLLKNAVASIFPVAIILRT
jgi:glycosyltransferase involved in cell wall biosynthesis